MLSFMVRVALGRVMEIWSGKHWEMSNNGSTNIENHVTILSQILENAMELISESNRKYSGYCWKSIGTHVGNAALKPLDIGKLIERLSSN